MQTNDKCKDKQIYQKLLFLSFSREAIEKYTPSSFCMSNISKLNKKHIKKYYFSYSELNSYQYCPTKMIWKVKSAINWLDVLGNSK